ncbi:uncharacterized protein LOC143219850 [Lasioglossum baleicum]|uniref:uncharacterized protein LOC143219850 n=1 Tax=Lasioglossum baleicum TaxID=434251 RepID=UPI003FCCAA2A
MASRDTALKSFKRVRTTIKGQITRVQTYVLETQDLSIYDLEARIAKVKELVVAYEDVQANIENLDEESDHVSERDSFERSAFALQALLASHADRLRGVREATLPSRQASTSIESTNCKPANKMLPKIQIPSFDGNLINWFSFYDTFKSLVHENVDLPNVQKFHYLKNSLRGEISSIVASLSASSENYLVAWDMLQKRCNRPRQLIQAHLKQLFDLPEIIRDTPANLRKLAEQAQVHVNALKGLNQPINSWDQILIFIIVKKVDKTTRRAWERKLENDELPTFQKFIDFINTQARGEEWESEKSNSPSDNDTSRVKSKRSFSHLTTNKSVSCVICQDEHYVFACPKFLAMEVKDRLKSAQKSKLCLNCLKVGHNTVSCKWSHCRKCDKKHNTLLHLNAHKITQVSVQRASEDSKDTQVETDVTCKALMAVNNSEVLLGTAQITIYDNNNKRHTCRVLVDGGSQSNYMTESLANLLQLKKERVNISSSGLSNLVTCAKYCVNAKIQSNINNFSSNLKFIALPTITGTLPTRAINHKELKIPKNVCLADPEFYKPGSIDILLGSTIFYKLLSVGQIQLNNNRIILQKTKLGWLVTGEVEVKAFNRNTACFHSLDNQIAKFWEVEELPKRIFLSDEEATCEEHYKQNTRRDQSGRYIVRLPFNEKRSLLGDSHKLALKRFYTLENKLIKNTVLYEQYKDFLAEYESLNHMSEVSADDHNSGFYLPHHAVIKASSATTKVRVVFDASAKSSSGVSLNDTLLVGPTIQNTLFTTLIKFRTHICVLTADIEKMFRQVKVHEEDSYYQKILWRQSVEHPLKTYKLNTVTYGTACAPFLAIRCLKQLAEDDAKGFPLAARAFDQDFYVDDLLTGASDFNSALKLRNELIELAKLGGFNLRQWVSNDKNLVNDLDNNQENKSLGLDVSNTKKTLGIFWNPSEDNIIYETNLPDSKPRITKRLILSEIAQLFDPLGLLGPVIIQAKIIMQELWKTHCEWDEVVPQSIYYSWIRFRDQLRVLNQFSIRRPLLIKNHTDCQLHGFCDASESAYGACIFVRVTMGNMQHSVNLLCAKSRVAPIKTQSLPRLELCAATLLSKLVSEVMEALTQIKFSKIRLWTDSTIVLHWIKTSPHLLKTFVANRVSDLQASTDARDWFHVPTLDNPADYISRGQDPQHFLNNITWTSGPHWLSKEENCWPNLLLETIDIPEKRNLVSLVTVNEPNSILVRFSSFTTLYRVVAYIRRFFSRRGKARNIYTDNGTNFVGSRNQIMELQALIWSEEFNNTIQHTLSNDNINWHFSPPRSPHFGGLWEAAVKSFKRHLFRTIGETLFTYEQFNSLIIQIEAILNSRPIIPISSDPNDLIALTPGHFLIGDSLTNLPECDLTEVAANRLSLWQHIQQVKQHFWKRWHTDYLHELHTRNKWHRQDSSQMKVGTLVTIQEDNVPPMHWRLGRIVIVHPGDDNIVRVVTVKTAQGLYKRSTTKLSPLPIE